MWRRGGLGRKGMVQLPSNDSLFLLQKPAKERSPFLLVSLDNGFWIDAPRSRSHCHHLPPSSLPHSTGIFEQLNNHLIIPRVRIEQLHHAFLSFLANEDGGGMEEQGTFSLQKIWKRTVTVTQLGERGIVHSLILTCTQNTDIFALQTKPHMVPVTLQHLSFVWLLIATTTYRERMHTCSRDRRRTRSDACSRCYGSLHNSWHTSKHSDRSCQYPVGDDDTKSRARREDATWEFVPILTLPGFIVIPDMQKCYCVCRRETVRGYSEERPTLAYTTCHDRESFKRVGKRERETRREHCL